MLTVSWPQVAVVFDSLDNFKNYMESDFRSETMEPALAEFSTLATSELCAPTSSHTALRRPASQLHRWPRLFYLLIVKLSFGCLIVSMLDWLWADVGNRVYDEL